MEQPPILPTPDDALAAQRADAREQRTVERAFEAWCALASGGALPIAVALAEAIRPLRVGQPPELDDESVERLSLLALVAQRTGTPVAFEGRSSADTGEPRLIRAAILPARATGGAVAVTAVFAAVEVTAWLPTAG